MTGSYFFLHCVKDKKGMVSTIKKHSSKITVKVVSGQIGFLKLFYSFFIY